MIEKMIEKVISLLDPIGVIGLGPLDEYKDIAKIVYAFLLKNDYKSLKQYLINQYPTEKDVVIEKVDIAVELLIDLMNNFD